MNQQRFDDSTLIRIFALHELHRLKEHGLTRVELLDYHSRYKLVFLAHSQPEYRKLGPGVADIHRWQCLADYYNQYRQRVIVLLSHPANRRDHTNVLMHAQGYFRPHIDSTERQQLALGPGVADIHRWQCLADYYNQYRQRVIVLLSHPANRRDHTNVLMHAQAYFRPNI